MIVRRVMQGLVLFVLCLLPLGYGTDWQWIRGNFFSWSVLGVPFADPVALVQVLCSGGSGALLLWGALASLLLAFVLGRVFCGWICPYGLFSELVFLVRAKKGRVTSSRQARYEQYTKLVLFLLGCGCAFFDLPLLAFLSFPGQLSLAPALVWQEKTLSLALLQLLALPGAALSLEFLLGERWWCRYCCPQGLLLGAAAWCGSLLRQRGWPLTGFFWHPSACSCKGPAPCAAGCSLRLAPRQALGAARHRCTVCGDCLRACTRYGGALQWGCRASVLPEKRH